MSQFIPVPGPSQDAFNALSDQILNIGKTTNWTPKLYDYTTYKRDLEDGKYFKIGNFVVATIMIDGPDFTGISTMIQIRNIPISNVIGGVVYLATLQSSPIFVQGSGSYAYLRPNIKSSDFADPTSPGMFQMVIFGYDN